MSHNSQGLQKTAVFIFLSYINVIEKNVKLTLFYDFMKICVVQLFIFINLEFSNNLFTKIKIKIYEKKLS